jgi:periplasmic protein CpxP/Spy
MTAEVKSKIEDELKRFATDLNLSDSQKTQLRSALERAENKIEEIRKTNPDVTRADVIQKLAQERDHIREHVVKFFTPEQLTKWDAEIARAKTFLGHQVRA